MTGWANFSFFLIIASHWFSYWQGPQEATKNFIPKCWDYWHFVLFLEEKKCKKREELAESLPSSLFTRNYFLLLDRGPSCSAVFPLLLTVNNFQLVLTLFAQTVLYLLGVMRETDELRIWGRSRALLCWGLCLWTPLLTFSFLTPLRERKYFYRVEHFGKYIRGNARFDLVPAEVNDNVLVALWEMVMLCQDCPQKTLVFIWYLSQAGKLYLWIQFLNLSGCLNV